MTIPLGTYGLLLKPERTLTQTERAETHLFPRQRGTALAFDGTEFK